MATEKIAVTIERELLQKLEQLRRRTHESRSAVVSRALRELLELRDREERVGRYVAAYQDAPETDADTEAANCLAIEALEGVPWEET